MTGTAKKGSKKTRLPMSSDDSDREPAKLSEPEEGVSCTVFSRNIHLMLCVHPIWFLGLRHWLGKGGYISIYIYQCTDFLVYVSSVEKNITTK